MHGECISVNSIILPLKNHFFKIDKTRIFKITEQNYPSQLLMTLVILVSLYRFYCNDSCYFISQAKVGLNLRFRAKKLNRQYFICTNTFTINGYGNKGKIA